MNANYFYRNKHFTIYIRHYTVYLKLSAVYQLHLNKTERKKRTSKNVLSSLIPQ